MYFRVRTQTQHHPHAGMYRGGAILGRGRGEGFRRFCRLHSTPPQWQITSWTAIQHLSQASNPNRNYLHQHHEYTTHIYHVLTVMLAVTGGDTQLAATAGVTLCPSPVECELPRQPEMDNAQGCSTWNTSLIPVNPASKHNGALLRIYYVACCLLQLSKNMKRIE